MLILLTSDIMLDTDEIIEPGTDEFNLPKYSVPYRVGSIDGDIHFDCTEHGTIEVLPYLIKKGKEYKPYGFSLEIAMEVNDFSNITDLIRQKVKGKDAQYYGIEFKPLADFIFA